MDMSKISAGKDLPHDFNVVIEIPAQSDPVKYEVDKESGALLVDRFIGTSMRYPANYGFIPQTLGDDGDPVDVCVITPFPLLAGSVIRCRPLGMLLMEDESGGDMKMLAVPVQKLMDAVRKAAKKDPRLLSLSSFKLFDLYKPQDGANVGKKSLAFNMLLQRPDAQLSEEEADEAVAAVVKALAKEGAVLRD